MKTILLYLCLSFMLLACTGRTPHPVKEKYFQDTMKTCAELEKELSYIQNDILYLEDKTIGRRTRNMGILVAAFHVHAAAFALDLVNADKIEYDALRKRYNYLIYVGSQKECTTQRQAIPLRPGMLKN